MSMLLRAAWGRSVRAGSSVRLHLARGPCLLPPGRVATALQRAGLSTAASTPAPAPPSTVSQVEAAHSGGAGEGAYTDEGDESVLHFLWRILKFAGITYVLQTSGGYLSLTTGPSMMPTLATDGEVVFVDCLSPALGVPIQRGDIIIAESWVKDDYKVCKRVIGLPGDYIQTQEWLPPTKVPDGHIWIEGDNPQNSLDSRTYGPIPAAAVTGRVVATVWPPWRARRLRAGEPRPASNTMLESAMLADPDVVSHAHHLAKRAAAGHRRHQENMKALADVLTALEKAKEEEKARGGAAAANTTTPDEVARDVTVEASSASVNAPVPRTE